MQPSFWHARWKDGQIGFHQDLIHPDLIKHQDCFLGGTAQRVLVPLCGKSRDVAWLAAQGHDVVGVELSAIAAQALFDEAGHSPNISEQGAVQRWQSANITVYVGDLFDVTDAQFGAVDRIWDRAALVALPAEMRRRYVARLLSVLSPSGRILLNCFQADWQRSGPPHSIDLHELDALYAPMTHKRLLNAHDDMETNSKWRDYGATAFIVSTWLLSR